MPRFKVFGAYKSTGQDCAQLYTADDEETAVARAGEVMLVEKVIRLPEPPSHTKVDGEREQVIEVAKPISTAEPATPPAPPPVADPPPVHYASPSTPAPQPIEMSRGVSASGKPSLTWQEYFGKVMLIIFAGCSYVGGFGSLANGCMSGGRGLQRFAPDNAIGATANAMESIESMTRTIGLLLLGAVWHCGVMLIDNRAVMRRIQRRLDNR